jgi:hypothetical protein
MMVAIRGQILIEDQFGLGSLNQGDAQSPAIEGIWQ